MGPREAYPAVSLVWLWIALVGAVPFLLGGAGNLARPENALFEAMSGITTTGATVVVDFAAQSRSMLLWRSLLQWLAGPFASYAPFSPASKELMTVMMWVGRLEIIPIPVLLPPTYWRS